MWHPNENTFMKKGKIKIDANSMMLTWRVGDLGLLQTR